MSSIAVDLDEASTMELVNAASMIAAELARRTPPESAAACMQLTESLAAASDMHEAALSGLISVVDRSREVQQWGFPSTQSWLRSRLGMRDARAKERLTLARQRDRLTQMTRRWTAGESLSRRRVLLICGRLRPIRWASSSWVHPKSSSS